MIVIIRQKGKEKFNLLNINKLFSSQEKNKIF